jgi:hypothetical protein
VTKSSGSGSDRTPNMTIYSRSYNGNVRFKDTTYRQICASFRVIREK